jgi:hypothetical protein
MENGSFILANHLIFSILTPKKLRMKNGSNLFDRNLYEDFDDILLIDRKYFRAVKSDKSNKVTTIIVYELIAPNH